MSLVWLAAAYQILTDLTPRDAQFFLIVLDQWRTEPWYVLGKGLAVAGEAVFAVLIAVLAIGVSYVAFLRRERRSN